MSATLESVSIQIATLHETVERLERAVNKIAAAPPAGKPNTSGVAADHELDDKFGDKEIKYPPKSWKGEFRPCRMSEAEPALLRAHAGLCDWKAGKAEEKNEQTKTGKPLAPYLRKEAALARGWAARNESRGIVGPPMPADDFAPDPETTDGEIPF